MSTALATAMFATIIRAHFGLAHIMLTMVAVRLTPALAVSSKCSTRGVRGRACTRLLSNSRAKTGKDNLEEAFVQIIGSDAGLQS